MAPVLTKLSVDLQVLTYVFSARIVTTSVVFVVAEAAHQLRIC